MLPIEDFVKRSATSLKQQIDENSDHLAHISRLDSGSYPATMENIFGVTSTNDTRTASQNFQNQVNKLEKGIASLSESVYKLSVSTPSSKKINFGGLAFTSL